MLVEFDEEPEIEFEEEKDLTLEAFIALIREDAGHLANFSSDTDPGVMRLRKAADLLEQAAPIDEEWLFDNAPNYLIWRKLHRLYWMLDEFVARQNLMGSGHPADSLFADVESYFREMAEKAIPEAFEVRQKYDAHDKTEEIPEWLEQDCETLQEIGAP